MITSNPQHSLTYNYLAPISASVITWPSSLWVSSPHLIRTAVTLDKTLSITWFHLLRPYLQIRSHTQVWGLGIEHNFLGDIFQPTTMSLCLVSLQDSNNEFFLHLNEFGPWSQLGNKEELVSCTNIVAKSLCLQKETKKAEMYRGLRSAIFCHLY